MAHNARYAKLQIEYAKLLNLADNSDFVEFNPIEVQPGWPPEKYIVTYRCAGIAMLDEKGAPVRSDFHQVLISMGRDFPRTEPYLKWLTPIWHPNIEHEEPYHVCTNNVQNWWPGKTLADLVVAMGEMVQYKRYHAKPVSPFPLDREAAQWVINYAEPRGILGPDTPFDKRPLLRLPKIRPQHVPLPAEEGASSRSAQSSRMRIGKANTGGLPATAEAHKIFTGAGPVKSRPTGSIVIGRTVYENRDMICPKCNAKNNIDSERAATQKPICGNCRAALGALA